MSKVRSHVLLRSEFTNREILVANDQADLALARVPTQRPAETPEFDQISGILDVGGRRTAMNDDWLGPHQHAVPFIVAPDSFRLRVGSRPSEHTSKHFQGSGDPALLVNRSRPVTLDTGHEQDNQDTLAPALQERSLSDGLPATLRHFSINIVGRGEANRR